MSLNIYDYHTNPEKLKGHGNDIVPLYHWLQKFLEWHSIIQIQNRENYINNKSKIERLISNGDGEVCYEYAKYILNNPFKLGEKAIAASPQYSTAYATDILMDRFELGEKAIASDPWFKQQYITFNL